MKLSISISYPLICILFLASCGPIEDVRSLTDIDCRPPVLLGIKALDSHTVLLSFSEETVFYKGSIHTEPEVDIRQTSYSGTEILISTGASLSAGNKYSLAAQVEDDGRLAVIVSREQAHEVLGAIRENGRVSVNFTLPANYRSFNLSGRDAVAVDGGARYRALVDQRRKAFTAQLEAHGFAPEYTDAWYSCPDEDLVAIRFTPISARDQTPGPGAGRPLELNG